MGLGLNGHLSSLKELSLHDYLCNVRDFRELISVIINMLLGMLGL